MSVPHQIMPLSRQGKYVSFQPETSGQSDSKAWMVTFTDLVSLMLTFFVMIFAMSDVKDSEWESMTDSLSQTLKPAEKNSVTAASATYNIGTVFRKEAISLDYLTSIFSEAIKQDELLSNARLMRLEDRMIIALPGDILFAPGKAEITEKAEKALFILGGILRNIGNQIGVNSHSGENAKIDDQYSGSWELSVARAAAVANTMRRSGYRDKIISFGFSDTRLTLLPDMPEEQKQRLARRVDIIIMPNADTL